MLDHTQMFAALLAFIASTPVMPDGGSSAHSFGTDLPALYSVSQHGFSSPKPLCRLETADILKSITVGILTPSGSGSGVVIGKNGHTYTILTSKHVISSVLGGDEVEVYSPVTKKYYPVLDKHFVKGSSADIALVRFNSRDELKIAVLNSFYRAKPIMDQSVIEPLGRLWSVDTGGGRGAGISMPSGAISVPVLRYTEFTLQERANGNRDGYEFIYQASTVPGMSGGPITGYRTLGDTGFGAFGLIAIHGRSEEYVSGGRSGTSLAVPIDLVSGYLLENSAKYGIPVADSAIVSLLNTQYCR